MHLSWWFFRSTFSFWNQFVCFSVLQHFQRILLWKTTQTIAKELPTCFHHVTVLMHFHRFPQTLTILQYLKTKLNPLDRMTEFFFLPFWSYSKWEKQRISTAHLLTKQQNLLSWKFDFSEQGYNFLIISDKKRAVSDHFSHWNSIDLLAWS